MKSTPIVVEAIYRAAISVVWSAISDHTEMKKWYFDLQTFEPIPGFKFQFYAGSEGNQFLHLCEVTESIPNKRLTYSWKYDGYPGESLVTFELFEEGEHTRLKLTHTGLETFPQDQSDFAKENFEAGWKEIIGKNLKEYVENL